MLADLAADQPPVRRAAVRGLADHPEAVTAICDRLDVEASPSVRAVLFTTLIQLQSPEVAARLADLLRSDDVPLRNAAIEALQEMPDAVAPHLERLLADETATSASSPSIYWRHCRHARASEWLTDVIRPTRTSTSVPPL